MNELEKAGLFGRGLFTVNTPSMVARYNSCLEQLNIAPTALAGFRIDGMGWSPEVAAEKGDNFYLSHGIANQLAIILSPDQSGKPIWFPFHSFDRRLMRQYGERFATEIADITASSGLWLDLDQDLTCLQSPYDLLLVEYIIIRSSAGDLLVSAANQRKLVKRFTNEPDSCFDENLRQEIIASAKTYGDLRFRRLEIPDMKFSDLGSFYTRAFNGVFVFRHLPSSKSLLIFQDSAVWDKYHDSRHTSFCLNDPVVIEYLVGAGLAVVDLVWYQKHLDRLANIKEAVIANTLCDALPDLDCQALTSAQKKALIVENKSAFPDAFFELEKLRKLLEQSGPAKRIRVPPGLYQMLLRPRQNLPESVSDVVWHLLSKLQPWHIFRTYLFDKETFFHVYPTWPRSKQQWAIQFIRDRYVPLMDLPSTRKKEQSHE